MYDMDFIMTASSNYRTDASKSEKHQKYETLYSRAIQMSA